MTYLLPGYTKKGDDYHIVSQSPQKPQNPQIPDMQGRPAQPVGHCRGGKPNLIQQQFFLPPKVSECQDIVTTQTQQQPQFNSTWHNLSWV